MTEYDLAIAPKAAIDGHCYFHSVHEETKAERISGTNLRLQDHTLTAQNPARTSAL
jgi:hypothetical protein